jgi:plasmid stabilization system protein ParE
VAKIDWPDYIEDLLDELDPDEVSLIFEKTRILRQFPRLYPVRSTGRFRRHRRLLAGNWMIYYRVVDDTVYIRGIWPAVIP